MNPIEFPERNMVVAEDQQEYMSLPAHVKEHDPHGEVISCWELTEEERKLIAETGKIWLSLWTFGKALQPVAMSVTSPFEKADRG